MNGPVESDAPALPNPMPALFSIGRAPFPHSVEVEVDDPGKDHRQRPMRHGLGPKLVRRRPTGQAAQAQLHGLGIGLRAGDFAVLRAFQQFVAWVLLQSFLGHAFRICRVARPKMS